MTEAIVRRAEDADLAAIAWLAEAGGHQVGMMNLAIFERMPRPGRAPSRWGHLGNAFILAPYRDRASARSVVGAVLGYADENGFARVVLSPADRSIPFYERDTLGGRLAGRQCRTAGANEGGQRLRAGPVA